MTIEHVDWKAVQKVIDDIVEMQRKQLLASGRRIVPTLTPEDMLQPNDYPELEYDPHFRYEEGILAGVQTIQIALSSLRKQN